MQNHYRKGHGDQVQHWQNIEDVEALGKWLKSHQMLLSIKKNRVENELHILILDGEILEEISDEL